MPWPTKPTFLVCPICQKDIKQAAYVCPGCATTAASSARREG
ncbi:MAG: hypothetical protein Q6373_009165 [Candidatus Sigynarchaeota archaeon]